MRAVLFLNSRMNKHVSFLTNIQISTKKGFIAVGFVGYQWSLNFLSVVIGRAQKGREERGHAEEREKIVSLILSYSLCLAPLL